MADAVPPPNRILNWLWSRGRKPQSASVPFMVTNRMRADLYALGYAEREVDAMRPTDAHAALIASRSTPWWHRTVSGLVLALCTVTCAGVCWLVSWLALCVFVGGCAVGYPLREDGTADTNDAIIGISTGTANAAGAGLLSLGGLLSGNPAIVGLAALVANQVGKRQGWDEKQSDDLKTRGIVATKE